MTMMGIRLAGMPRKSGILIVPATRVAPVCTACKGDVSPNLSYKAPALLPFHIPVGNQSANPTISGNVSLITELGTFSVGAQYRLPPPVPGYIRVI